MGCNKKAWALGFIFPTTRVFPGRPPANLGGLTAAYSIAGICHA